MTEIELIISIVTLLSVGVFILRYIGADKQNELQVEFIFPVKLEYTPDQWFAWDSDDEFLGQAQTKEALINMIAQDNDLPIEKFQVVYEYPLRNQLRPT